MPQVTVKVQGKADPEMGKKRGRIKSDTGMLFQATPELLSKVAVGETYDILYKDESFRDANYRVVEAVYPATGPSLAPQAQSNTAARAMAAVTTPHQVSNFPDHKSELIACLSIIKSPCFSKPVNFDRFGVAEVLKIAALGLRDFEKWQRTQNITTGPQPSVADDMNDEIPSF